MRRCANPSSPSVHCWSPKPPHSQRALLELTHLIYLCTLKEHKGRNRLLGLFGGSLLLKTELSQEPNHVWESSLKPVSWNWKLSVKKQRNTQSKLLHIIPVKYISLRLTQTFYKRLFWNLTYFMKTYVRIFPLSIPLKIPWYFVCIFYSTDYFAVPIMSQTLSRKENRKSFHFHEAHILGRSQAKNKHKMYPGLISAKV